MSTVYYAVTDEEENVWDGIQLAQTAGGWKPTIQWHGEPGGCSCNCNRHHYRNWEEFKEFVRSGYVIKDEYGRVVKVEDFIQQLEDWQKKNERDNYHQTRDARSWMIDGWNFCSGDWS